MKVPFFDLNQQYRELRGDIHAAMQEVFDASTYCGGPETERFESDFASYCRGAHCVAVNSGTSALHLALRAIGVGPGDEVITTPMTFVATIAAIEYCGAKPLFVDCAPDTLTINPLHIKACLTPNTKAILPVHIHGCMADMETIATISKDSSIPVVEDAAQAHGSVWNEKKAGTMGLAGCFSFYPSKNLGGYGEGGAVITNDNNVAQRLRMLRNWGTFGNTDLHHLKGFNCRLNGLQGAILRVKLKHLERWNNRRRQLAARYHERLRGLELILPLQYADARHVYYVYAVRTPVRDKLRAFLSEKEIETRIHYATPVHLQPAYQTSDYKLGSLPVSERACRELLSLPLYPEMSESHLDRTCDAIRTFFHGRA